MHLPIASLTSAKHNKFPPYINIQIQYTFQTSLAIYCEIPNQTQLYPTGIYNAEGVQATAIT